MKKFIKELLKRLVKPTVYTPIIAFIISVAITSGNIDLGEGQVSQIVELVVQIVTTILVALGVANNPSDKANF